MLNYLRTLVCVSLLAVTFAAQAQQITILHTNDWQSRFLGFGPNLEYSPETINDDETVGGLARLATLIDQRRQQAAANGPVLLLDGGDFSMGTLFHTITRETGAELQLLTELGYDAVTLGNHEFDFRPDGLAQMFRSAQSRRADLVPVVTSNLQFDSQDPADDSLQAVMDDGLIREGLLIERGGITFGLFGLIGVDAAEVAPNKAPVTMADQVATAQRMEASLRADGADLVILLSHMGVTPNGGSQWHGEEVDIAEQVPGIDLVIGGHSHTPLSQPIVVEGTPIVQAGSEGQFLGELVLNWNEGELSIEKYQLYPIDDRIPGDPRIIAMIDDWKQQVTEKVLKPAGYYFDQPLVTTPRTLTRAYEDPVLGNLITDAFRRATQADIALTGNGTIRDDVWLGQSGQQSVSDLYRIEPLGVGELNDDPGYPMMKVWFTAADLKSIFEVLLLGYQLRGDAYYPRLSGVRVTYNNYRPPFDRVTKVELGGAELGYVELDLSRDNTELYSIGGTSYVGGFTWLIGDISYGLLDATPRDQAGNPVADIRQALVDGDLTQPGVQEIKAWKAILDHLSALPDHNGDGIADIQLDVMTEEVRILPASSLNPSAVLANAGMIAWGVYGLVLLLLILSAWLLLRFFKKRT
ncbi:bifunctional metallophosphatase/5'-nucleotidase [Aestuariirhabdus sp. Z084]|uniref:bifunctional metallophosphatase/5'-nucleotidase n=1 Tax=Aestuariirhabdus haliotis TaxID=2918751 RepID=UPI00201B38BF|nr:bifunctional UDP-sugar hydrolase/5'-nucleotidase [Aestuariirhabdus haliotis]MCL6417416.1 bifunctional metallophosphatase/5'-nucleotidase [Aestuariirhabdus haliotis]MCL6421360.1 bifunctional metallophosphatase/5'-nucleotidase [Aestuariirhabdus haliotis]